MRAVPYLLYLFLIAMHEVMWRDLISIYGTSVNLAAFFVLGVALYKTEVTTVWFGFAAGLILAAGMPDIIGWHALALAFLGFAAFQVRERLNLNSLYAKLLLMFGGVFFHNMLVVVINQPDAFVYLLWANALTGAVYTSVLTIVFFVFKEGRLTLQKLKTIF